MVTRPIEPAFSDAATFQVVGVVASPSSAGRHTMAAVDAVLAGADRFGAATRRVDASACALDEVVSIVSGADAVVFGSPVYRSTHTALMSSVLESLGRGEAYENDAPLKGTAAAIVMTGGSDAHFLGTGHLRSVLSDFFAVQVLAPSLYCNPGDFGEDGSLVEATYGMAIRHGAALCELANAIRRGDVLATLGPLH